MGPKKELDSKSKVVMELTNWAFFSKPIKYKLKSEN